MMMKAYMFARLRPFNKRALGAKIPDSYTYPTATWMTRTTQSLASDSNGLGAVSATPMPSEVFFNPASITSGTITWTGGSVTGMNGNTQFQNMSALSRAVGWGLRITCDLALSSATGHVWIAACPADYYSDQYGLLYLPSTEGHFEALPNSIKYPLSELILKPKIMSGKALDDGSHRFRDYHNPGAAGNQIESGTGWASLVVMIVGAPASTASVLNIEHILHLEYVIQPNTGYFTDACSCPQNNQILEHVNNVSQNVPVALEDSKELDPRLNDEVDDEEVGKLFGWWGPSIKRSHDYEKYPRGNDSVREALLAGMEGGW
jgi:hypothetical protein